MEKTERIERAKIYMSMLIEGVHPVTGAPIEDNSVLDEKVKNCFSFIIEILDEYVALAEKAERLEAEKETVVLLEK